MEKRADMIREYQIHRTAAGATICIYPIRGRNQITLLEEWHGLCAFWTDEILDVVDGHRGGDGGFDCGAASIRAITRRNR
jgi:hypothetical protein